MRKQDGSGWKLSKIPVMEIFGPTIQGEGMVIGQKTMFVRTAGCDYSCAWCDSRSVREGVLMTSGDAVGLGIGGDWNVKNKDLNRVKCRARTRLPPPQKGPRGPLQWKV